MFARPTSFILFSFNAPVSVETIPFKHIGYGGLSPMGVVWETLVNEAL